MRRQVEDGIRQTRERIAGSSLRVNVFLGYHSNGDGKSLKIEILSDRVGTFGRLADSLRMTMLIAWSDTSAKRGTGVWMGRG